MPDVDSSLLHKAKRQQPGGYQDGGAATCPFNPDHPGATPITSEYPYNGAINGLPGKGVGGYQLPAPGDTAHQFTPPDQMTFVSLFPYSESPTNSNHHI
jgi:hypothetical protein